MQGQLYQPAPICAAAKAGRLTPLTMLELLIEIFGEFLLQIFGEALAEIGLHSLAEPFRRSPDPWLASLGFLLFGALLGALSVLVFKAHFIPADYRLLNLVLTPMAVGACMAALGAWRAKRGDPVLRIDRFAYGYLFALSFGLVRFFFAH